MIRRLAFAAATVLALLLLAEGALRLLGFHDNPLVRFQTGIGGDSFSSFDPELFWDHPRGAPRFSPALGSPAPLKVMVLADSVAVMCEGGQYPRMLEKLLERAVPDRSVQVVDGSVTGYTSYQGLKFFQRHLPHARPDVLVVNFGWNDHWLPGNGLPDKDQRPPRGASLSLLQRSRLAGALLRSARWMRVGMYSAFLPGHTPRVSLEDYERNLERFVDLAKRNGIRLILSTAPALEDGQRWLRTHQRYNQTARRVAARHGVALVDLVELFRDQPGLYIAPDSDQVHYNSTGGYLVARAVADTILRGMR